MILDSSLIKTPLQLQGDEPEPARSQTVLTVWREIWKLLNYS